MKQRDILVDLCAHKADSVNQVVATMRAMDRALEPSDGLKWFNLLYLTVTENVQKEIASARWSDPAWLERLDIVFANLYFDAVRSALTDPGRTPHAWVPLFDSRRSPKPVRIQFALAGMNAHINRDLCRALILTLQEKPAFPRRNSGIYADYCRVNLILEGAEDKAQRFLATGIVGMVDQALGDIDDILAMWSVRKAREAAWINAEVLWQLRSLPVLADRYFGRLDRMTGFAGRGLLR